MNLKPGKHVVITGGAGYIGSLLTGSLLRNGYLVSVVDALLFGGEALLAYLPDPNFYFQKADILEPQALHTLGKTGWPTPSAVIHLAGIVGFPACQAVGKQVAWRYNVEGTHHVYKAAVKQGAERFIFASTYSNYGLSKDGKPVDEEAPLNPQSLYAETKVAAEEFLLAQSDQACTPLILRFATLYGISPRTRFDLIVNQFVLEAYTQRELLIYQRGYSRSFVHIRDIIHGVCLGLEAPLDKIRRQVYNIGTEKGNFTKDEIVGMILQRIPETSVHYKDLSFGGDMRDIRVSFEKAERELGFQTKLSVDDGIREVLNAIRSGLIRDPQAAHYRNAQFIVQ